MADNGQQGAATGVSITDVNYKFLEIFSRPRTACQPRWSKEEVDARTSANIDTRTATAAGVPSRDVGRTDKSEEWSAKEAKAAILINLLLDPSEITDDELDNLTMPLKSTAKANIKAERARTFSLLFGAGKDSYLPTMIDEVMDHHDLEIYFKQTTRHINTLLIDGETDLAQKCRVACEQNLAMVDEHFSDLIEQTRTGKRGPCYAGASRFPPGAQHQNRLMISECQRLNRLRQFFANLRVNLDQVSGLATAKLFPVPEIYHQMSVNDRIKFWKAHFDAHCYQWLSPLSRKVSHAKNLADPSIRSWLEHLFSITCEALQFHVRCRVSESERLARMMGNANSRLATPLKSDLEGFKNVVRNAKSEWEAMGNTAPSLDQLQVFSGCLDSDRNLAKSYIPPARRGEDDLEWANDGF